MSGRLLDVAVKCVASYRIEGEQPSPTGRVASRFKTVAVTGVEGRTGEALRRSTALVAQVPQRDFGFHVLFEDCNGAYTSNDHRVISKESAFPHVVGRSTALRVA